MNIIYNALHPTVGLSECLNFIDFAKRISYTKFCPFFGFCAYKHTCCIHKNKIKRPK